MCLCQSTHLLIAGMKTNFKRKTFYITPINTYMAHFMQKSWSTRCTSGTWDSVRLYPVFHIYDLSLFSKHKHNFRSVKIIFWKSFIVKIFRDCSAEVCTGRNRLLEMLTQTRRFTSILGVNSHFMSFTHPLYPVNLQISK